MSDIPDLSFLVRGIRENTIVPYLGPGALADARDKTTGEAIPADSEALILAMNDGKPMHPKLMYEFPRAAMDRELKRGRNAVNRFLSELYDRDSWSRAPLHDWLATVRPKYVIDINRDTQLQASYADVPHTLIRGTARIGGTHNRFVIHAYDGTSYHEVEDQSVNPDLPVLFKPMGSPAPDPTFIASDADYVDYITELMGGFAIPPFLKKKRQGKQYLLIGLRLTRDTERMVLSDIVYGAGAPVGWALIADATAKEKRFCARLGIEIIDAAAAALLTAASNVTAPAPSPTVVSSTHFRGL
ncbi:SIR2 family protein [Varunaivibrio sulfuroxidans]|uniref:SIR2-like protein n=1 Tax=Varunaivibrio sulfuroxidans TaxID=1773489 RepID=A0A4R3J752_9PROT|nr:SIR2 family protein [Varunaivibrio sulfuroxidans]TCS61739.1 SIR2-like protein [Varunaivibrio sulfuroxidans]WES32076.1 SIR2 family protein [Varunaivibrio sulfuroxidans]